MVKGLHEIKLRDVILLDVTKKADSLKSWYIPLWLVRGKVEKLCKDIFDAIGNSTVDNLRDEFDKLMSYRKLQMYEALYKAVIIELGLKSRVNAWKIILNKDLRKSALLEQILEEVKTHTGIELKTQGDLKILEDFIKHKIDKHKEMFPEVEKSEVKLIDVFNSVFIYMNQPVNLDLDLSAFLSMKKMAEEKVRTPKQSEDGTD